MERSAIPARRIPGARNDCETNIDPNLPAPTRPTWIGLPAASRAASLVERLVMVVDVGGLKRRNEIEVEVELDDLPDSGLGKEEGEEMRRDFLLLSWKMKNEKR